MNQTVSTHTTAIEAHIVKARLEFEGIPASVAFEHHIWASWSLSVALGGVRVQVPFSYLKEATQIVENINNGEYELELEEETSCSEPTNCPKCISQISISVNWLWKFALVVVFLLPISIPIPYTQHLMKCEECSHTWVASEQRGYPLYIPFFATLILGALIFIGAVIMKSLSLVRIVL